MANTSFDPQSLPPAGIFSVETAELQEKETQGSQKQIHGPCRDLSCLFVKNAFQAAGLLRKQDFIDTQAVARYLRGSLSEGLQPTRKEQTHLDEDIEAIQHNTLTHHDFVEVVKDVAVHHIGEYFEGPVGMGVELTAHMLTSEPPKDSKSPVRDQVLESASEMVVDGAVTLIPQLHDWRVLAVAAGSHVLAKGARVVETKLQERYEERCSEKSLVNSYLCQPLNEGILLAKGLQLPSEVLHSLKGIVMKGSAKALDAAHVTDETLKRASDTLADAVHESYEQKRQHPELFDILS